MKTEEIIERLRNPKKYQKTANQPEKSEVKPSPSAQQEEKGPSLLVLGLVACVLGIAAIVLLIALNAQKRAENLSEALDPAKVQGLTYETDFNPYNDPTYIQVYEGQDRNVSVTELGTTLPIISRYNYQAITPKNYGIIGAAPWALTENFSANINDPELIRYLLNRQEVSDAFIARPDVAPLLEDPQLLAAFAQDDANLNAFFTSDTVQKVLANPQMVRVVGASRLMSHMLTSKAVKYYRDRPQEAAQIIKQSPVLSALAQNDGIRQAVQENYYLKPIAAQILGPKQGAYAPAVPAGTPAQVKK